MSERVETQVIEDLESYNPKKSIVTGKVIAGKTPDNIAFYRIPVETKNPDGTRGDLIVTTPDDVFCFGVSENKDQKTGVLTGWSTGLCLYTKDGATEKEKKFVEKFEEIIDVLKEKTVENRKLIKKFDLEKRDLKKLDPLYWKKNSEGERLPGVGPVLYAKLIFSKKSNSVMTLFFDNKDESEINYLDLVGKYFHIKPYIKIESIYVGVSITLQVKLYNGYVSHLAGGVKKLSIRRPIVENTVRVSSSSGNPMNEDEENTVETSSLKDENEPSSPKPESPKVEKKKTSKKVKVKEEEPEQQEEEPAPESPKAKKKASKKTK